VRIHTEHHAVFNGLKEYGHSGIDGSSKVRILMKGIKTTELDICKANIMTNPEMHDNFEAMVELYSTFIKQTKVDNPQINVSEVNYSKNKEGGNNSSGKLGSSGISNTEVDNRLYDKYKYHALSSEQNNTLRLKSVKGVHVGKTQGSVGKVGGKSIHAQNIKSMERTRAVLGANFDKFNLPDDDDDETSEDKDGYDASNCSNQALTRNTKKRGGYPES
jgi:hypothetical protein